MAARLCCRLCISCDGPVPRGWALAALGVTRLPLMLIEPQLAAGHLVRVLSQCRFDGPSLYAVYPRDRLRPPSVQALLGHLQLRRAPRQAEA